MKVEILTAETCTYPFPLGQDWYCLTHETFGCEVWGVHDVEPRSVPEAGEQ